MVCLMVFSDGLTFLCDRTSSVSHLPGSHIPNPQLLAGLAVGRLATLTEEIV